MKNTIPFFLMTLLVINIASSQTTIGLKHLNNIEEQCATDIIHQYRMSTDSIYHQLFLIGEKKLRNTIRKQESGMRTDTLITLPIVFHIIHLGEAEGTGSNVSESQILNSLNGVNDRFRAIVGDGVDVNIEFCMAVRDPYGYPTNGINRVDGSGIPDYSTVGISYNGSPGADEYAVKDLSKWPTTDYINIWVVHNIYSSIIGYATPYLNTIDPYDGIVVEYGYMSSSYTTMTHEMGHFLNLRHTFQGDGTGNTCPPDTDCTTDGDAICDTPPHKRSNCGTSNTCSSSGDWDNSRKNFMSYCGTNRMRFTEDQKTRSRASLSSIGRVQLTTSLGCVELPINDAGITDYLASCDSSISVILKNYGTDTLKTVDINWSMDGIAQPTYHWSGSLPVQENTIADIGNFPLSYGIGHNFNAWTSDPNSTSDPIVENDSLLAVVMYLSLDVGTYSIGGSTPDFSTLTDAINAVNLGGICGPIVFDIRDDIYNEQIQINDIQGASPSNTITFQSESADNTAVEITFASTDFDHNYTVLMDNSKYIIFKNLTLSALSSSFADIVSVKDGSHLEFYNCIFKGVVDQGILLGTDYQATFSNSIIKNNTFINGNIGASIRGLYNTRGDSIDLDSNNFVDQKLYGISLSYQNNPAVTNNSLITTSNNNFSRGMNINKCIEPHIIANTVAGFLRGGIYFDGGYPNESGIAICANNFIQLNAINGNSRGIEIYDSKDVHIYNNSVHLTGNANMSSAFYCRNGSSNDNNKLLNNIFSNSAGGYAIYISHFAGYVGISSSDYNDLYTTGDNIGFFLGNQIDLNAWNTASSFGVHSVSIDPKFDTDIDLHICNNSLDGLGQSTPLVLDDIDQTLRNIVTPDMGADEFEIATAGLPNALYIDEISGDPFSISAVFQALDTIIVQGNMNVNTGIQIEFDAPNVIFEQQLDLHHLSNISIKPYGCTD